MRVMSPESQAIVDAALAYREAERALDAHRRQWSRLHPDERMRWRAERTRLTDVVSTARLALLAVARGE